MDRNKFWKERNMKKNIGTVCVHGKNERKDTDKTGAVSFPIYQ